MGKLNIEWQKVHQVSASGTPMAHTKKGGKFDRIYRPPKHAWIGAWMVLDYLLETFDEDRDDSILTKLVFWAIADHHGYSDSLSKRDIQPYEIGFLEYLDTMAEQNDWIEDKWDSSILDPIVLNNSQTENVYKNLSNQAFQLQPDDELDLYFMFSYILRKADQNATKMVSIEKEVERNKNKQIGNFV